MNFTKDIQFKKRRCIIGWFALKVNASENKDKNSQKLIVLRTEDVVELLDCEQIKVTESGLILGKATPSNAPDPTSEATVWPYSDFKTRIRTKYGFYNTFVHIDEVVRLWIDGADKTREDIPEILKLARASEKMKVTKSELN